MSGTAKFELSSVSPDDSSFSGSYPNGRGNYLGHSLDRSGSFREGTEGRTFNSGTGSSKPNALSVADFPPLSQFINLEPVTLGDQKYTRAGELRRALGLTFGNVSEDNSFGAAHTKPPPMLATDELKRFRGSVREGSLKARRWVKRWDESISKLNKYSDGLNSKKQQANERSGRPNFIKMETQSHRSSPDLATQKLEERKNIVLNKRARTPIGDIRAEGRSNGVLRQHLGVGKEKDAIKEGGSDVAEENIRRLPAGGEGWDKKMKRKRSMSSVFHRPVDSDGELKRTMLGRLGNDTVIHASDSHGFRSATPNCSNGTNKLDGNQSPASLSARVTPKNEPEKASLSRELAGGSKERLLQKVNAKLNMREDTHMFSSGSVTKGKGSRAHRTTPLVVGNSSPSFSRILGTPEDWEQPQNGNKVQSLAGVTNRKRPLPAESSSPPMAQWVQRPQKISRNRRMNIVSPTSNHDEVQISPEECASDFTARIPGGINGSLTATNILNSAQPLKMKFENATSPARLSEGEENSAVENIQKDKSIGSPEVHEKGTSGHQHVSSSGLLTKKSKLVAKDGIGDGVRRQGRTGRGASLSRGSMSPYREKLENPTAPKPVRSARPGSEKNGSKSGRPPLKKHSDRKGFTRLGTVPYSGSPDFTGESDDDREELLQAAQFACNASYNGCSSSFWKRMEPLFSFRPEYKSFLEEQLKLVAEPQSCLSEMPGMGDKVMNHDIHCEHTQTQSFVCEEQKNSVLDNGLAESVKVENLINQLQDHESSFKWLDAKKGSNNLTPLYQRVLSALIVEDEFVEFKENNFEISDDPLNRNEPFVVAPQISCNGNATNRRFASIQVPELEELKESDYGFIHKMSQAGPVPFQRDVDGSLDILTNASGDSSFQCQYGQMSMNKKLLIELQSVGLYPEAVPDLAEGDDELINQDIVQLKKQLSYQTGKKLVQLDRIHRAMGDKEFEGRELEGLAMNRLTELAYRKLLATRGSSAARMGISKVSRHVALAFIKRTLARCRQFEDAGKSCFMEPVLHDVLFAVPTCNVSVGNCVNPAAQTMRADARTSGSEQSDLQNEKAEKGPFDAYETLSHQPEHTFAKNGPILNRGKKKEVLLDDVGSAASIRPASNLGSTLLGGAKGKRTERDSGVKAGCPSISNLRGERKTKAKSKQKATQMTTHPVQPSASVSSEVALGNNSRKREGLIMPGNILDSSIENKDSMDLANLPLHELDSIEDLSVVNEFDGHQDLSSWLNFDEVDGLQDHDSMGLEIPMDDLSELNMFS